MATVKCFNKTTIIKANKLAIKRNYNRQLEPSFLKSLPDDQLFPAFFTMIHEHADGVRVDPHVRCWVAFDAKGTRAFIDCDMNLYNSLYKAFIPDKEEAK